MTKQCTVKLDGKHIDIHTFALYALMLCTSDDYSCGLRETDGPMKRKI